MKRYRVLSGVDCRKQNILFNELSQWYDSDWIHFLIDFKDEDNPVLIASDRMDNVSFKGDLSWIPELLNQFNDELKNAKAEVNAGND